MTVTRRNLLCGAVLMGTSLAMGCTAIPGKTPVAVLLDVGPAVNPNIDGAPSPVVVRVYELKSLKAFAAASYFDLVDNEAKVLGGELLASHEYELAPGQKQALQAEYSSDAGFIGVIAGFRDIQSAQWRDAIALRKGGKNSLTVSLTNLAVKIERSRGPGADDS